MSDDLPEAIPAATLIIFRQARNGPPELLMVERAKAMVFAGGAMVFPGGRIDPGDHALAELTGGDEETAARIAAVRETIEEAGLPIGLSELPSAEQLAQMRAALHGGATLAEALAGADATLDLAQLVPWARWRPAHRNMRIFDTRFYLAELPVDAPHATVDQTENVRLVWATAQQVLADADEGKLEVIFPTRRNLERLALFSSFADAAAHARETPIRTVTPWSETRGDAEHLCIPDDCGYPVTSEVIASAMRG
ncbi:NUDIX domain-containing protein [Sphingomonas sp. OV641]|uniref:NUDIX hydrolase n=1 Tax=Sphingomonas sp. OV641 TaxID=1881068 RepID=UPI0008B5A5B7|nr:NUDIX domain-containing protein [Sphingomonas sp. OV641]SEJ39903.1 NUDIX domain-containing protein [Sphingomonas sp. OV641]